MKQPLGIRALSCLQSNLTIRAHRPELPGIEEEILQKWNTCASAMKECDLPDLSRVEEEVKWEASQLQAAIESEKLSRSKIVEDGTAHSTTPAGWEGRNPFPINTVEDFDRWLAHELRCRDDLMPRSAIGRAVVEGPGNGRSLRNAYRLIEQLEQLKDLSPKPLGPLTYREETDHLRQLRIECRRYLELPEGAGDAAQDATDKAPASPKKQKNKLSKPIDPRDLASASIPSRVGMFLN